ncbi:MAG: histidinol-phosphate transaminase [Clostridia bacterium]|nr:histidinol-phosphate transaminase [Clostridia bacterium]
MSSRFFSDKYSSLTPYTPGEQPKDRNYVKLNTNESPFPPEEKVITAVAREACNVELYSDPDCRDLRDSMSGVFGVPKDRIVMVNGSDEALNFAFMAFADERRPLAFPDITYGFYPVFAELDHIPYTEIPLKDDFTIDINDYIGSGKTVVIANPNAPTGICLPLGDIEKIVAGNPDTVVIIDEAYVDFGGESAVGLTEKYDNLLVVGTFSKSRSLAGARLGFAIGNEKLIDDLNTIRYSTNPYNVNRMTQRAGIAVLEENEKYLAKCGIIIENREYTARKLTELGFRVLPSGANFIFAESDSVSGEELYLKLKERGVLIRHFTKPRISNFNRITIGTKEQMDVLIDEIRNILRK